MSYWRARKAQDESSRGSFMDIFKDVQQHLIDNIAQKVAQLLGNQLELMKKQIKTVERQNHNINHKLMKLHGKLNITRNKCCCLKRFKSKGSLVKNVNSQNVNSQKAKASPTAPIPPKDVKSDDHNIKKSIASYHYGHAAHSPVQPNSSPVTTTNQIPKRSPVQKQPPVRSSHNAPRHAEHQQQYVPTRETPTLSPARPAGRQIQRRQVRCSYYSHNEETLHGSSDCFVSKLQQDLSSENIDLSTNKWEPGNMQPSADQPLLAFCPIVSRLGTDIDSMFNTMHLKDVSNVILVVCHHQAPHIRPPTLSDQLLFQYQDRVCKIVDLVFQKDRGLYDCVTNTKSTNIVTNLFQLQAV